MGLEAGTVAAIIAASGAGAGAVGSALATPSNQERQSYRGTAFDPIAVNSGTHRSIRQALDAALTRATLPVDLPNAYIQDLPTFTGGGLPTPIGVTGRVPLNLRGGPLPGSPGSTPSPPPYTPTPPGPDDEPDSAPETPGRRDPIPGDPTPPEIAVPRVPPGPLPRPEPLPESPDDRETVPAIPSQSGPRRLAFGASSGSNAVPQVSLSPQTRGAVTLLLQSLQGMSGSTAGGRR